MARWPFCFYFVPSLPEILWKVGSLAWRVCAPRCVGLYLLRPQPSRDPLEGGLVHLASLHATACWSLIYLLHPQPSRDPLEGGLAGLVSLRATACWPLFLSFPAFRRSSGRWAHPLGEPACHGALALLFLFRSQPSRDPLEDGLAGLAGLCATACWSLFISFPAFQRSSGRWARSPGEPACHGTLAFLFFISFPAFQRSSGRWVHWLGESARHGTLAFIYFIPSLPEILWKVGLSAW
jgi:hypothetical protein